MKEIDNLINHKLSQSRKSRHLNNKSKKSNPTKLNSSKEPPRKQQVNNFEADEFSDFRAENLGFLPQRRQDLN